MVSVGTDCILWAPLKELQELVQNAVYNQDGETIPDLEAGLRKHRPTFMALLDHPGKDPSSRDSVKKAVNDGIRLPGTTSPQILPAQLIDETLLISDMYDLNEMVALELLITGEQQIPCYCDLSRGLVSVLLYYDGRQSLALSLRTLSQICAGRTWTLQTPSDLASIVNTYMKELVDEGILEKIIDTLPRLKWDKEVELLEKNRALGLPRHRRQVKELFQSTQSCLAETLFCWAAQKGLQKETTLRLLDLLSRTPVSDPIEDWMLGLLMAALYSIDVSLLLNPDVSDEVMMHHPLLADPEFVPRIHCELIDGRQWECPGMKAVLQLAWGVALRTLSQQPDVQDLGQFIEEDEGLINAAMEGRALHFLHTYVLSNQKVWEEEFATRRLHFLLSDFIMLLPLKLKELRNGAEEAGRIALLHSQQGLEPPNSTPPSFQELLSLLAKLYEKDPLELCLSLDYWCPSDGVHPYRAANRQVSLFKFVRMAGDLLPPPLYIPYIQFLTSLSKNTKSAACCFNLLKQNGHGSTVAWDHFFVALNRYYEIMRQEQTSGRDTIYRRNATKGIVPQEVMGIGAVLNLIATISQNCEAGRLFASDETMWTSGGVMVMLTGLLGCPIPAFLKAAVLKVLAAFAKAPHFAQQIWENLEKAQVLQTVPTTLQYQSGGIQAELEEIEARNEEFPLSRAMVNLISALVESPLPAALGTGSRSPGIEPYVNFIKDNVFLNFNTRSYSNPAEKWQVAADCLEVLHKLLEAYQPSAEDFASSSVEVTKYGGQLNITQGKVPGFHILIQLFQDSPLLKMLLWIIDESCILLGQHVDFQGKEYCENASLLCLKILHVALSLQDSFVTLLRESSSQLLLTQLDRLLLGTNPRTSQPDHPINFIRYVNYGWWLPSHAENSLCVLKDICKLPSAQKQILALLSSNKSLPLQLRHGFVECLDVEDREDVMDKGRIARAEARKKVLDLLLLCLDAPAPNLAHWLLGFPIDKPIWEASLLDAGVHSSPRTCFHAVLSMIDDPKSILYRGRSTELGYKLIFRLAYSPDTSAAVGRYLYSARDMLSTHLRRLPFPNECGVEGLSAMSWLLKLTALELKVSSGSQRQRIIHILTGSGEEERGTADPSMYDAAFSLLSYSTMHRKHRGSVGRQKLVELLEWLDFSMSSISAPEWELFDPALVEDVVYSCRVRQANGVELVDVKAFHNILHSQYNAIKGTAAMGQRQAVLKEIHNILEWVVKVNASLEIGSGKLAYFDGWRKVAEVLLCSCSPESVPGRSRLIIDLTQVLLQKVLMDTSNPKLVSMGCGVILLLLSNLRQCLLYSPEEGSTVPSIQILLSGILELITTRKHNEQRVRVYLYGALLQLLKMSCKDPSAITDTLLELGDNFIEVVCRDSSVGHGIARMEALMTLDLLILLRAKGNCTKYLNSRGYLRQLIDSLLPDSIHLMQEIAPSETNIAPQAIELFDCKMGLLSRICSSAEGAQLALQAGLLTRLGEMTVLSSRPDAGPTSDDPFSSTPLERYRRVWGATLRLCQTIFTSLGLRNRSSTHQVLYFLLSHEDAMLDVLRQSRSRMTPSDLEELATMTSVLACAAAVDLEGEAAAELEGKVNIVRRHLLSLLSRHPLDPSLPDANSRITLRTVANVLQYARRLMLQNNRGAIKLLFRPSLAEATGKDAQLQELSINVSAPSLGVLVYQLKQCCAAFNKAHQNYMLRAHQKEDTQALGQEQIAELLGDSKVVLLGEERKQQITHKLQKLMDMEESQRELSSFATENALCLLWRHLEFYFIQAPSLAGHEDIMEVTFTKEELNKLKADSLILFSDSFFQAISDMEKVYVSKRSHVSFLEAMIRRIKHILLQSTKL